MKKSDHLKIALYHELSNELNKLPSTEDVLVLDALIKTQVVREHLNLMPQNMYESIEESIEQVDEVADQYPEDELELDMSELEEQVEQEIYRAEEVYDVTDDMIVEVMDDSTPLSRLEGFLEKVQLYKFKRDYLIDNSN